MKKTKKILAATKEPRIPALVTGLWAAAMLSVFPVIYSDFYFNILETKFLTFCVLTMVMTVVMALWFLFSGRWLRGFRAPEFSAMDWCMLAFFLTSFLATILAAPYVRQAVTGEEGRYTGMLYVAFLTAAYVCMRGGFRFRPGYVMLFLWVSLFVCLFGITDFYNMNLLHFRDFMKEEQYGMFVSTIGNINTYTAFVGFVISLSGTLFVLSEEKKPRIVFYFVTLGVGFLALILGSSDNGYLTLAAFFGFLPLVAFRRWRWTRRYAMTLALFVTALSYAGYVSRVKAGEVQYIDGLFQILTKGRMLPAAAALLWVLAMILFYPEQRRKHQTKEENGEPVQLRFAWVILLALCILGLVALFVQANGMEYEEVVKRYGSLAPYLKFRDQWGTQRGYVWRAAVEEYGALSLRQKLTGTGPDTFAIYMMLHRWKEMGDITGQFYDSAHNEYLQYLFTIGPFGLLSYLGLMFCGGRAAWRKGSRLLNGSEQSGISGAYFYAILFLILCYAAQAVVNISIPIATPILWVFVMMVAAEEREGIAGGKRVQNLSPIPQRV
ncbi:hypothetical protein B6K86_02325 [Lachnospiraceae bacterium]|nr:hypothetical protein B6K86_02325 [Lachnospiraceae bacterium]